MKRLVDEAHERLRAHLRPGNRVIDATAGNGHDTLFLRRAVGDEGSVIAIDRQEAALEATRQRLDEAGAGANVQLAHACHADHMEMLAEAQGACFAAITFNLGYLPGSDKRIRTGPGTTRRALQAAARLLRPGGLLSVLAYTGHEGGAEEAAVVEAWIQEAGQSGWRIEKIGGASATEASPPLLWIARKPEA